MRINRYATFIFSLLLPLLLTGASAFAQAGWPQWGQNQQHQGFVETQGQAANSILADKVYDPFTAAEERDTGGDLLVHYQVPILDV